MSDAMAEGGDSKVRNVYPYLRVHDANAAIEFYAQAFSAKEKFRLCEPSGRVGHAEMLLGENSIMLSDEYPENGILGPLSVGGASCSIHLHVENVDELLAQAAAAGGIIVRAAEDQFYGERSAMIRDPFGHEWLLGHEIEQVSFEEMQRRFDALFE